MYAYSRNILKHKKDRQKFIISHERIMKKFRYNLNFIFLLYISHFLKNWNHVGDIVLLPSLLNITL